MPYSSDMTLATDRLRLRRLNAGDLKYLIKMHSDPIVMKYFPSTLDAEETRDLMARIEARHEGEQFGIRAVEIPGLTPCAGLVGLNRPHFETPVSPCVEVLWRLDRDYWGQGYATEAARAAVAHGFADCGLDEIVAFAVANNAPSLRVMERLGMRRDPACDFLHPLLDPDDALAPHVLYRLSRRGWEAGNPPKRQSISRSY